MPIAVPTLAVADAETGGLITATISGSTALTMNTLRYQSVNGELGTSTWTSAGSRTADGTISATVAKGFYWWKVDSVFGTESVVSNLVYQKVTSGLDAVDVRIMEAAVSRIQALDLDGVAEVRWIELPFEEKLSFPCVMLTYFAKIEAGLPGTLQRDDFGYPILVVLMARDPQDETHRDRMQLWRQSIRRSFVHQRLPGVEEVLDCDFEPEPLIDWNEQMYQLKRSQFVLRFRTREVRGFAA